MKNLFGKFASLAFVLGVAVSLSSCHRGGDDPEAILPTKITTVELKPAKTLVVKLDKNVGATVSYKGTTLTAADGMNYKVENTSDGTLKIGVPSGYVPVEDINVKFGSKSTVSLEVSIVKLSTPVTPAVAISDGVSNDDSNETETGVSADLTVPSTVVLDPTNPSTDFSVTVFSTPVDPGTSDVKKGESVSVSPFEVYCLPDGATFPDAATIKLKVEGASEIGSPAFKLRNKETKQYLTITDITNDVITASIDHFSIQELLLNMTCTNIDTTYVKIDAIGGNNTLVAGENLIKWKEYAGFETTATGVVAKTFQALYGATLSQVEKEDTKEATGNGTFTLKQQKFTITYQVGDKTFSVVTYGKVLIDVEYKAIEPIVEPDATHDGGGGGDRI